MILLLGPTKRCMSPSVTHSWPHGLRIVLVDEFWVPTFCDPRPTNRQVLPAPQLKKEYATRKTSIRVAPLGQQFVKHPCHQAIDRLWISQALFVEQEDKVPRSDLRFPCRS